MTRQEFSAWLKAEIAGLTHPEIDEALCEEAAGTVAEARRIAESLGWPDLVPPMLARAISPPSARRLLSKALAVVDPPASGPLTVKQAAEWMGVSPKTIYDLVEKGRLRCTRVGKAIRIRPGDLEMGGEQKYKHLRL
jgi:excisionase family DNA binding protein